MFVQLLQRLQLFFRSPPPGYPLANTKALTGEAGGGGGPGSPGAASSHRALGGAAPCCPGAREEGVPGARASSRRLPEESKWRVNILLGSRRGWVQERGMGPEAGGRLGEFPASSWRCQLTFPRRAGAILKGRLGMRLRLNLATGALRLLAQGGLR